MPNDFKAWWIPGDYETQEYKYTTSPISKIPILFATATKVMHLNNYCQIRYKPL
ncbi:MAG: hypothetical protein ACRC0A_00960 [Chitinophagaceae bacterium]